MRNFLAGIILALAAGGTASAATLEITGGAAGNIPGSAASNEGLSPLGFGTSLAGYYGSTINLSGPAKLTFTLLGAEAGNTNTFTYLPTSQTLVFGGTNSWSGTGFASFSADQVISGLIPFSFATNTVGSPVLNGSNPNNTASHLPGINFFASFGGAGMTSGTSLFLFFDDDGANNDDNHDDLVIRVDVAAIPLPASLLLLGAGLGGLAVFRRRKTA